jgi:hypothetical protein
MSPGAPKGNRNAFKHGRYTAEAIANRREITTPLRTMRALARETMVMNYAWRAEPSEQTGHSSWLKDHIRRAKPSTFQMGWCS